jgi:HEAT repeat protein
MAKNLTEIKSLARLHTARALSVLAGIMDEPKSPAASRVAAAEALLNRGWGKAAQALTGGDEDDNPLRVIVTGVKRDGD